MKKCHRFHIEDVQIGDVLELSDPVSSQFDEDEPPLKEITVGYITRTHNFGWLIKAPWPSEDIVYYNDYDEVRLKS